MGKLILFRLLPYIVKIAFYEALMQTIVRKTLSDVMFHKDIPILTYTIHYPVFSTNCCQEAAVSINRFYEVQAKNAELYCRTVIYQEALEQSKYAQKNQIPFQKYEFLYVYRVTYNCRCITSLYTDQYSYLGGAHGNTVRDSHTWDFSTGNQLSLSDFFPDNPQFTEIIFNAAEQQIAERQANQPSTFFDNYASLLRDNFNVNSFYLSPGGIVIYYQQYEIAPYVTGIPEFFFPFVDCPAGSFICYPAQART